MIGPAHGIPGQQAFCRVRVQKAQAPRTRGIWLSAVVGFREVVQASHEKPKRLSVNARHTSCTRLVGHRCLFCEVKSASAPRQPTKSQPFDARARESGGAWIRDTRDGSPANAGMAGIRDRCWA